MTEKEFISWLRGYVAGALPRMQQYSTGEEVLQLINERLNDINSSDVKYLLNKIDPKRTTIA